MSFGLWQKCLKYLELECDERDLNLWLRPLRAVEEQDALFLYAPNRFVMNRVESEFLLKIRRFIDQISENADQAVELRLGAGMSSSDPGEKKSLTATNAPIPGNPIDPRYTFDNFVEGPSNQMARLWAMMVAEQPGAHYNPFFIYGGVGLGKTHLMYALANYIITDNPTRRVAYVQSERFVSGMIKALQRGRIDDFKDQYRSLDTLLIDDIQFFAGKERSQEEFFHTFNTLLEGRHQIVLTSDRYPKELEGLEERLKSRFGWGLIAAIEPPELETRVAIILRKAEEQEMAIPEQVAFFIAQRISSNVRELEGALRRVLATARFTERPVSVELARTALKDLLAVQRKLVSIENIQRTVAGYFRIRAADLRSRSRSRSIARPRQIAMSLAKELTTHSLPEIGDAFGGRDHTTVLHACRKVKALCNEDPRVEEDYRNLLRVLSG